MAAFVTCGSQALWRRRAAGGVGQSRCTQRAAPGMQLVSHELVEEVFDGGERKIGRYKLRLCIPAALSKATLSSALAEFKKRANFPGFRKGQIPPFMRPQVHEFTLMESIDAALSTAKDELGLQSLDGDAADPVFETPVADMAKTFEVGKDFTFTCDISLQSVPKDAPDPDAAQATEDVTMVAASEGE